MAYDYIDIKQNRAQNGALWYTTKHAHSTILILKQLSVSSQQESSWPTQEGFQICHNYKAYKSNGCVGQSWRP